MFGSDPKITIFALYSRRCQTLFQNDLITFTAGLLLLNNDLQFLEELNFIMYISGQIMVVVAVI